MDERLGPQAMLGLFAGEPKNRTGDSDYPYRQQSDFLYLTGLTQPGATLVLLPGNQGWRELLFLPERDPRARRGPDTCTRPTRPRRSPASSTCCRPGPSRTSSTRSSRAIRSGLIKYFTTDEYQALFKALDTDRAEIFLKVGGQRLSAEQLTQEQRFADRIRTRLPGARVRDASQALTELS
jgi:Xaa-Pro aminopeptidase